MEAITKLKSGRKPLFNYANLSLGETLPVDKYQRFNARNSANRWGSEQKPKREFIWQTHDEVNFVLKRVK